MNFFLESLWLGLNNKTDAERQFFLKDKSFKKGSIKQTNKIGIVIIILDKIEWKNISCKNRYFILTKMYKP